MVKVTKGWEIVDVETGEVLVFAKTNEDIAKVTEDIPEDLRYR